MNGPYVKSLFHLGSAPVLEESMKFAEDRHRLILSNIANADTPGYRRQDLEVKRFQDSLDRAIRDRATRTPRQFHVSDPARQPIGTWRGTLPGRVVSQLDHEGPLRHDENNISPEREMALLAQNAGKFRTMANLLRKEWSQMRAAISERSSS